MREAGYGSAIGRLVMMVYGEPNVFYGRDARAILAKAHAALREGGIVLLEAHTFAAVQRKGEQPPTWYSSTSGLFMGTTALPDRPPLA
jgi:hypothetical protein